MMDRNYTEETIMTQDKPVSIKWKKIEINYV